MVSTISEKLRTGSGSVRSAVGYLIARLPLRTSSGLGHRLLKQANRARDAGHFEIAAMLYEEVLLLLPYRWRLHVQCGHAYKETGDWPNAERHYEAALERSPGNADLALQLGHFYKASKRPEEALSAYERALELRPGWDEAGHEQANIRSSMEGDAPINQDSAIIPQLLPRTTGDLMPLFGRIHVRRLAARRIRTPTGVVKALHGIEAIRGFCISALPLTEVQLLLGGAEIARQALRSETLMGSVGQYKHVFNIWYDFSATPAGEYDIEIRLRSAVGSGPRHRQRATVLEATSNRPDPGAGAGGDRSAVPAEEIVNARPTEVRQGRRSILPAGIGSILVQRADQLGDLVCSVPAIRRLRELFPNARIVGLLTRANVELGRALNLFDEIVVAEFVEDERAKRRAMTAAEQIRLKSALIRFHFDLAIDLCEAPDSRPLLLLSNASFLYGFASPGISLLSSSFTMSAADRSNGLETIAPARKILALIEGLGALRCSETPACVAGGSNGADRLLEKLGLVRDRSFIVLHSGARLKFSRWPYFAQLCSLLLQKTDYQIILMRDDPADAADVDATPRLAVIDGKLPFEEFDALLSACAAFVGNDSGIKHLAGLRNTPTVSLHMARLNWSEWGQESGLILSRDVPCSGCAIHHHPEECGKDFACIRHIRPEEVLDAVCSIARHSDARDACTSTT